jgi:Tfp pilus assembly protein FimT
VTAIELVTLVVLLVIIAAFAIPGMSPVVLRYRLRGAAWQVAGDLRLARQQAVTMRKRFRVCVTNCAIAVPAGAYSIERDDGSVTAASWKSTTGATRRLPQDVQLQVDRPATMFQMTGTTADTGTFLLTNAIGSYAVTVTTTGRIRVCEGSSCPQ